MTILDCQHIMISLRREHSKFIWSTGEINVELQLKSHLTQKYACFLRVIWNICVSMYLNYIYLFWFSSGSSCWCDLHHFASWEQKRLFWPARLHHWGPGGPLCWSLQPDLPCCLSTETVRVCFQCWYLNQAKMDICLLSHNTYCHSNHDWNQIIAFWLLIIWDINSYWYVPKSSSNTATLVITGIQIFSAPTGPWNPGRLWCDRGHHWIEISQLGQRWTSCTAQWQWQTLAHHHRI